MKLQLLPIGEVDHELLGELRSRLPLLLGLPCEVLSTKLDPAATFHQERGQYHSSELLHRMQSLASPECGRLLGVAAVDLYIPILTFVFGEAQIGGPCAVVSTHRLRQEFYGLPPDHGLLGQRLLKEAVHELGHTFDLIHCHDYQCAMSASHAVEWIDLKESTLCTACQAQLTAISAKLISNQAPSGVR